MKPQIMHESWIRPIGHLFPLLENVRNSITVTVCPDPQYIFRAFERPFEETKVVIVGLSPYQTTHKGVKRATGLAFAVPNSDFDTPSLEMIREALYRDFFDISVEASFDWTLESWHNQGVMLLNRALTVPLNGHPRRHLNLWTEFTSGVLKAIDENLKVTFALWGNDAKELKTCISNNEIVECCHPVATSYELSRVGYNWDKVKDHLNFTKQQPFVKIKQNIKWL